MKKLLYIIACAAAVLTAGCSKDATSTIGRQGEGAVTFSVEQTRASEELLSLLKFRIYSISGDDKNLVRLYTYDEIKDMKMWLLAGNYSISVEGGNKSKASFTDVYYSGSKDFTITAGDEQTVKVTCSPINTMIKVVFDSSVAEKLNSARAIVAIDSEFNASNVATNAVPNLSYTSTAVGFFTLDDTQTTFAWNFSGKLKTTSVNVDKSGAYSPEGGFKSGAMYTITYKYSDDLGGYVTIDVTVDDTTTDYDDTITFKPEPQITGDGLNSILRLYTGMTPLAYDIKAINTISTLKVKVGDLTYSYSDATTDTTNGITVTKVSALNWTLELGDNFISKIGAGKQSFVLNVVDSEGAEGEVDPEVLGEGTFRATALDAWSGTATLKAYVNDAAASAIKIYYRLSGSTGDWTATDATLASDNIYTATAIGIEGDKSYEYCLSYNSVQKGSNAILKTVGAQIPNAGLEEWSGSSPLLPYTSVQKWDTGNHGTATLSVNVTTNSSDVRPGSTGQYSAYLKSQYVSLFGIGKFAAGNIFFGTYLDTSGTDGTIGFGQPYVFNYRPKKLTFWYKGTVGTADYAGGSLSKGDSDQASVYICLCNWTAQHKVSTADKSTFFKPSDASTAEGNIIAYGEWYNSTSYGSWTKIEIDLTYRDTTEVPNYLVIACSASRYGDYFAGSTGSDMYVDDFELVY